MQKVFYILRHTLILPSATAHIQGSDALLILLRLFYLTTIKSLSKGLLYLCRARHAIIRVDIDLLC